jgi:hypothetical protein
MKVNQSLLLLIISSVIALTFRVYFFYDLSCINNDDVAGYIPISENIFNHLMISVDGKTAHTLFPPGYSILLGLEKIIFQSYENVFLFNFVFITLVTSILIINFFKRFFTSWYHDSLIPFIILFPTVSTSRSILCGTSEYLFSLIIWGGIFLLFKYIYESKKIKHLVFANILFAFCYLMRPEGLSLFFISAIYVLFFFKKEAFRLGSILAFLIPFLVLILPYILFLYEHTGVLTISGKDQFNEDLSLQVFNSPLELYISNAKSVAGFVISPNYFNPLLHIGWISFVIAAFKKKISKEHLEKIALLFIPVFVIIIALIKYRPWSRVFFPHTVGFLIVSFIGWSVLLKEKQKTIFAWATVVIFSISIYAIRYSNATINHPILYNRACKEIKLLPGKKIVMSRDSKITFDLPNDSIYLLDTNYSVIPDVMMISNLTHTSLYPPDPEPFEVSHSNVERFNYKGSEFHFYKVIKKEEYFVKIFLKEK